MINTTLRPLAARSNPSGDAYSFLRKVVGVIAVTLPFVLVLGDAIVDRIDSAPTNSALPLGSISTYYYERTGGWFVGSLFALAVFFLSYDYKPERGRSADNLMSTFASVMAVAVALLPTASPGMQKDIVGWVHIICAGMLFVLLAIFSLYQFTKTSDEVTSETPWLERLQRLWRTAPEHAERMSPEKIKRNVVYRTCGWVIVACIVVAARGEIGGVNLFFWAEAVAIVAFGVSWLVKGGLFGILVDAPAENGLNDRPAAWR